MGGGKTPPKARWFKLADPSHHEPLRIQVRLVQLPYDARAFQDVNFPNHEPASQGVRLVLCSHAVLETQRKRVGMDKEEDLKALLERAKELKEIGEKLIKESDQLMGEYEALKLKKRGRTRTSSPPE
jgi:hypothetical protein